MNAIHGDPVKPENLKPDEALLWDKKVRDLTIRGVPLRGCEEMLRIYVGMICEIERKRAAHVDISVSMYGAVRQYSAAFFDDPSSQRVSAKPKGGRNAFADDPPPK